MHENKDKLLFKYATPLDEKLKDMFPSYSHTRDVRHGPSPILSQSILLLAEYSTDTIYQAHHKWGVTGCSTVSEMVKSHCQRFFRHLARIAPEEDHHCVKAATLWPTADWKRLAGRLRTTWLRTVDEDVQPQKFTLPGGRQKIRTFGAKSSVRQRSSPSRRKSDKK